MRAASSRRLSHQLHPQIPSDGLCGARERAEGYGLVLRVQQAIELRTAGSHALGKLGLRETLLLHERVQLARDHPLDGTRGHLLVDALFLQKIIKGRSDAALL